MSLAGRAVVVCRAVQQATPLLEGLRSAGATPTHVPLLEVVRPIDGGAALRDALHTAGTTTWLALTSANGVDAVVAAVADGCDLPSRIAVVGPATAARAATHGWTVGFVSPEPTAAGLGRTIPVGVGERVLVAVAELAGNDLERALIDRNIGVDVVTAYRTVIPDVSASDLRSIVDAQAVIVSSPSVVDRLADLIDPTDLPPLVAIGETTASAIHRHGLTVATVADEPSVDGLIDAVVRTLDS